MKKTSSEKDGDFLYLKGGFNLEVKINREIRNYTESMFFGLSLRQFIFSALACAVAVQRNDRRKISVDVDKERVPYTEKARIPSYQHLP